MKKILLLLLVSFNVYAIDLGTLDPTDPTQDTLTLACKKPLEYMDNATIAVGESVDIQWKVSKDGGVFVNTGGKVSLCSKVVDLTKVVDGDYIYKATAIVRGKESDLSDTLVSATVKRLPNPKAPSGLTGSVD